MAADFKFFAPEPTNTSAGYQLLAQGAAARTQAASTVADPFIAAVRANQQQRIEQQRMALSAKAQQAENDYRAAQTDIARGHLKLEQDKVQAELGAQSMEAQLNAGMMGGGQPQAAQPSAMMAPASPWDAMDTRGMQTALGGTPSAPQVAAPSGASTGERALSAASAPSAPVYPTAPTAAQLGGLPVTAQARVVENYRAQVAQTNAQAEAARKAKEAAAQTQAEQDTLTHLKDNMLKAKVRPDQIDAVDTTAKRDFKEAVRGGTEALQKRADEVQLDSWFKEIERPKREAIENDPTLSAKDRADAISQLDGLRTKAIGYPGDSGAKAKFYLEEQDRQKAAVDKAAEKQTESSPFHYLKGDPTFPKGGTIEDAPAHVKAKVMADAALEAAQEHTLATNDLIYSMAQSGAPADKQKEAVSSFSERYEATKDKIIADKAENIWAQGKWTHRTPPPAPAPTEEAMSHVVLQDAIKNAKTPEEAEALIRKGLGAPAPAAKAPAKRETPGFWESIGAGAFVPPMQ